MIFCYRISDAPVTETALVFWSRSWRKCQLLSFNIQKPEVLSVQPGFMYKHKLSTKNSSSISPFCKVLRTAISSDGEEFLCQARLQLERKSCYSA